jgi:SAM-dependent methyltransferase
MLDESLTAIAKTVMKLSPSEPARDDFGLWEVFRQPEFTAGSPEEQNRTKLRSARFRHEEEANRCYLDTYFPSIGPAEYHGRSVLDLGCFTAGRLVYWAERFGFSRAAGVDTMEVFVEAGRLLAAERQVEVDLRVGVAEALPFEDAAFDFVVSTDVLEHVQDVSKAMDEVWRVLKPGGRFLLAFPQFLNPYESHLGLVTRVPALHWFLPGRAIARAAHAIVAERGPDARWYARDSAELEAWERLPSLNGTSAAAFRRILRNHDWRMLERDTRPVRMSSPKPGRPLFNAAQRLVVAAAKTPLLEELLLARVRMVLQRPGR